MAASPLKVSRFLWLFAAGWLLWICLHTLVVNKYGYPFSVALWDSIISNGLLIGACILVSCILGFYLPTMQRSLFVFMLCVGLTIVWMLISYFLTIAVINDYNNFPSFFILSIPVRLVIGFLIIGCMALLSALWYTLQDQREAEKRKAEAEHLAKEAELFKLRQQLQPHFLFNSLNSINALIGVRPQQARTMIQQLSDFLRGTLKKEERQWTSLEDELQHLQLYLDIEKVRFGHRLSTMVENEAGSNCQLPPLLLQPIVENAIKFGLYDTTGELTISIHAREEGNMLIIAVQNPFDPSTTSPKHGTGFGLHSVQRRLFLLFARTDLLKTEAIDNLFTITIKIPQPGNIQLEQPKNIN
ncbi:histidine kinase [Chitinophagaceae bacterium LB-8]|uniref:Histidine kinase n=1 Tax=Paraflavisolibacter caeni TaxID=2982496 RepID=A0A9X2Y021_9BACT|nr:histidine kinase [Paraflavisolibacter caeni]MCU7552072.1 histidine kinase [Paraflavisolibacter caeni]